MTKPVFTTAAFDPFHLWTDFAMKSAEMLWSSGQVISSRLDRMARAGVNPSAHDRREMLLMGSEKVRAASDSALAVASRMQVANWELILRGWRQGFANLSAMGMLMASRNAGELFARQRHLFDSLRRSGPTHAHLSSDAARLATAALLPVHRAATANAKRLSRVRRTRR
jgi:hypothetical protein